MNLFLRSSIAIMVTLLVLTPSLAEAASDTNIAQKYRVYQNDQFLNDFTDLTKAKSYASKFTHSHVEEISSRKWLVHNFPRYRVYQFDHPIPNGEFTSLTEATALATKYSHASIKDLQSADWAWNNYEAIKSAKLYTHAEVRIGNQTLWSNEASYRVLQKDKVIAEFNILSDALAFALPTKDTSILTDLDERIWSSRTNLLFWGWNAASSLAVITDQLKTTAGLDIVSPSWFKLADVNGNLQDTSSQDGADWLIQQNYAVHALVSNQFDSNLTSQFLANPAAVEDFIHALVNRSAELKIKGINIDFEGISGKDRDAFTDFITQLTDYAHLNNLTISIDLPRGSLKWNHLTAFDHKQLGGIVDYIIVMAYDQFNVDSTSPGPVAGLDWVEQGIKEFLGYGIPQEKIIMGIPFYVRDWTLNKNGSLQSSKPIHVEDLPALLKGKKVKTTWDAAAGQNKLEYVDDGKKHVFWNENEATVKARIALAQKYQIAGVATWRLGYEPLSFWQTMLREK